jgi:hypothetical protein
MVPLLLAELAVVALSVTAPAARAQRIAIDLMCCALFSAFCMIAYYSCMILLSAL